MHAERRDRTGSRGGGLLDRLLESSGSVPAAAAASLVDLAVGPFWVGVRTTVGAGMASTLWSEGWRHHGSAVSDAGRLVGRPPAQLAAMVRSPSILEAAIGLAAINALLPSPGPCCAEEANASRVLAERGLGRRVAVIGHFPFVEALRSRCRELWVFERGSGWRAGDLREGRMAELLPRAEVVAVTATTVINHTLEGILAHRRSEALWLMLGPSTPFAPALFELGFDALCGTVMEEPDAALRAIREGATARQIPGCRRVVWWRPGVA